MLRRSPIVCLALLSLVAVLACDKGEEPAAKDEAADAKAEAAKPADAKAEAGEAPGEAAVEQAGAGVVVLPSLGVEGKVEGEAQVSEMMGSQLVQAGALTVTVEGGDERPKTGEEAQAAAADRSPADAKLETLADGYVLTFTNSGALGTNYWVEARRELGGKAIWCTTTASAQAQQDAAVAFCKGLRASE